MTTTEQELNDLGWTFYARFSDGAMAMAQDIDEWGRHQRYGVLSPDGIFKRISHEMINDRFDKEFIK